MTKRNSVSMMALCLLLLCSRAADSHAGSTDPNNLNTPSFRPAADEKKARLWALGCSALLMERNWAKHDTLETGPLTDVRIRDEQKRLSEWWNVENRADLLEALRGVEVRGHRKSFEADGKKATEGLGALQLMKLTMDPERAYELRMAGKYYKELGDKSLLGWDISRYICLCRWGYTVGYISEEEAWERILPAARLLQKHFTSWEELGENYLIGRRYWSAKRTQENGYLYTDAMTRLLESRNSPWVALPWNTDLGDGPVLGEPWSAGKTITVGQDANSISTAIDLATSGDTVYIPRGLYKESGLKLKDGIRLMGDGMGRTIIQGDPNDGWVITATDCSGRIEAITVEHTGVTAIRRDSGGIFIQRGNVEVVECEARNTAWEGIAIRSCPNAVITDCLATGNMRYGLLVRGDKCRVRIVGCRTRGNAHDGIYVKCAGEGRIERNMSIENAGNGIQVGSDMNGTFTILSNKASRNKACGIKAGNVESATIENNYVADNNDRGIMVLTGSGKAVIGQNRCRGNGARAIQVERIAADISRNDLYDNYGGILVMNSPKADISKNRVAECSKHSAIHLSDVTESVVKENECTYNKTCGIFVSGKSRARVEDNKCSNNGSDGIQFNGEAAGTISNNWCEDNADIGISVWKTQAGVTVMNNKCLKNGSGIYVRAARNVSVKDNLLKDNRAIGLEVAKAGHARAEGNTCEDNGRYGIIVSDANTTAMLKWNKCTGSSLGGIWFEDGAGGEADGNMCFENQWCGIGIRGEGTSPTLTKNRCNDNGAWGIIAWAGATLDNLPADNITKGNYKGGIITRPPTTAPND